MTNGRFSDDVASEAVRPWVRGEGAVEWGTGGGGTRRVGNGGERATPRHKKAGRSSGPRNHFSSQVPFPFISRV